MMTFLLLGVAEAGLVYFTAEDNIVEFDTRSLTSTPVAAMTLPVMNPGMALDPTRSEIWVYDSDITDSLEKYSLTTGRWTYYYQQGVLFGHALAYDPIADTVLASGYDGGPRMYSMPGALDLGFSGHELTGMDWYDDGGFVVGLDLTGDIYGWSTGGPAFLLASAPMAAIASVSNVGGLAFDKDSHLFWWFDWWSGLIVALEPEAFNVVAALMSPMPYPDGGAGSIDDVLLQTPELLVTGYCPGTVYVTAVDATPGGHVWMASGTRAGPRAVTSGACAGTTAGLQNPRPRFDLVANGVGVASTTIRATAQMCGSLMFQAIDADTCMATSVRSVPASWVP